MCCLPCREPIDVIKEKTSEAKKMVDVWKQSYLDVRAKIEASGRDARWEFDRRKLFDRTDYAGGICQELHDVVKVSPHTAHACTHSHIQQNNKQSGSPFGGTSAVPSCVNIFSHCSDCTLCTHVLYPTRRPSRSSTTYLGRS